MPDGGLLDLKGNELDIVRQEVTGFFLNVVLADRSPDLKVISGGNGIISTVSSGGTVVDNFVIDPGSGLPVQSFGTVLSGTVSADYRRVRDRMDYSEWQKVGGIQWPHKTIKFHDDVKRAEITTTEIKLNVGVRAAELAAKPH
ncbi:MAG TPA: hypothetical protein VKU01_15395 [Bryobacteraceae bacterium]|nr:hypothetical protein [Bryobacteraceae bacterium]